MDILTSLIVVFGFALVICLSVVKMAWDLSQLGAHDPPAIPETPATATESGRFADFAGVPYHNPLRRQQWEELWETEAQPEQLRIAAPRTTTW